MARRDPLTTPRGEDPGRPQRDQTIGFEEDTDRSNHLSEGDEVGLDPVNFEEDTEPPEHDLRVDKDSRESVNVPGRKPVLSVNVNLIVAE